MENVQCPYCKSFRVRVTDTKRRGGLVVRYFLCRDCAQSFRVNGGSVLCHKMHCKVRID